MPKAIIDNFTPGLHADVDATMLPRGAASACANVIMDTGGLRVRPGRAWVSGAAVKSVIEYAHNGDNRLFGLVGTQVKKSNGSGSAFGIIDGLTTTENAKVRMAQFKNAVYVVDGVKAVQRYQGSTVETLEGIPGPMDDEILLTPRTTISKLSLNGTNPSTVGYYADLWDSGLSNPPPITEWGLRAIAVANGGDDTIAAYGTRKLTSATYLDTGRSFATVFEIVGTDTGYLDRSKWGEWLCVRQVSATGMNLSEATQLVVRLAIHRNSTEDIDLHVQLGRTYAEGDANLEAILDAIDLTGLADGVVKEFAIPLGGVSVDVLQAVQYVAFKYVTHNNGAAGSNNDTPARLQNDVGIFDYGAPEAFSIVLHSLEANIASTDIQQDAVYEFTATYEDLVTHEESAEYRTTVDGQTRYPTLDTSGQIVNGFYITVSILPGTFDPDETRINIYVRGGAAGSEWVLAVGRWDPAPDANSYARLFWDGFTVDSTHPLPLYVKAPPVKATILSPYKGRMLYVAPNPADQGPCDTLFLSNWDDPAHVPQDLTFDAQAVSEQYGGWITVGEDGAPITGLGMWGSFGLVMKERGVWQLSGDTGANIAMTLIEPTAGCISHETIQQIADSVTVWLGVNHVWMRTPDDRIVNIGKPIESLLKAFSKTAQSNAFAVYDRVRRWYLLTIPGATAMSGTTFVLFPTGDGYAWTKWTGQPNSCACYASFLTTPGVYMGDEAASKVYRINEGVRDEGEQGVYAPIVWTWTGNKEAFPGADQLKTISEIVVHGGSVTRETGETAIASVNVQLWQNGAGGDNVPTSAATRTIDSVTRRNRWALPLHTPAERYQLTLSGSTATGGEILAVEMTAQARGGRRG